MFLRWLDAGAVNLLHSANDCDYLGKLAIGDSPLDTALPDHCSEGAAV